MLGFSFVLMDGGSPTAFCYCYEFKANLDRLALNYVFELRLSRCFFAVLLVTARFTGIGSRATVLLCVTCGTIAIAHFLSPLTPRLKALKA
jgi:hypothetical protein